MVLRGCKVERSMAAVAEEFDRRENRTGVNAPTFQFMRTGYFCMDNRDCTAEHLVFNRSVSLKDSSRSKEELSENKQRPGGHRPPGLLAKAPWGVFFSVQQPHHRHHGTEQHTGHRPDDPTPLRRHLQRLLLQKGVLLFAAGQEQRHGHQQSAQSG